MQYLSFGGGVDTMALLVLLARGEIEADAVLFSNVGEDSEDPATLDYVRQVAIPYAEQHNIPFHVLQKTRKDGRQDTILQTIKRPNRSIGIPARMSGSGAPGNRTCTLNFKVQVCASYAWKHGARPKKPATMLIGIALEEFSRARTDSGKSYITLAYPLIDKRLTRQDCIRIIEQEGLPVPPKSSCWFCPYRTLSNWQQMRQQRPVLFWQAVELEQFINQKRASIGKDQVWLSGALKPLDKATSELQQLSLWPAAKEEEYSCGVFACVAAA